MQRLVECSSRGMPLLENGVQYRCRGLSVWDKITLTMKILRALILPLILFSVTACRLAPDPGTPEPLPALSSPLPLQLPASPTPDPPPSPLPATATASPVPTATSQIEVCSPLQDVPLAQLPGRISNPFNPPPPGSDNPHAGVDLADRYQGAGPALEGLGVQAVLSGRVAAVVTDRFPFGNALLVETPLEGLPPAFLVQMQVPTPAPTPAAPPALTCPPGFSIETDGSRRSLYLLYAHLKAPAGLQLEEPIACGQALGAIGSTGNALNPHLHLEARVGPAGVRLSSMAHYDTGASPEEMANYCAWSVSGLFQVLDPMRLFSSP